MLVKYTVDSTGLPSYDTPLPSHFSTILGYSMGSPGQVVSLRMAGHKTAPVSVPLYLLVTTGDKYAHG